MRIKFESNDKAIFSFAKSPKVAKLVGDEAQKIANTARQAVRKTKNRSQWDIVENVSKISIKDQRNMFRIEVNKTKSGRRRAAVIVHSPSRIGRRDGRVALSKAAKFGTIGAIEAHKTKLKARRAAKSVNRFDIFYRNATGKSFL